MHAWASISTGPTIPKRKNQGRVHDDGKEVTPGLCYNCAVVHLLLFLFSPLTFRSVVVHGEDVRGRILYLVP